MGIRVAAAQLNPVVGDLGGNVRRAVDAVRRAEAAGARLCVLPELVITGYPPEDLLLKSGFVADNVGALKEVAAATGDCAAVVGFVEPLGHRRAGGLEDGAVTDPDHRPGTGAPGPALPTRLANAAAVCAGGTVVGVYRKRLLPNYSVFDEQRWFTPGWEAPVLYRVGGVATAVSICEDIWQDGGPVAEAGVAGAQLVVNLNASPYYRNRRAERLAMLERRASEVGCPIVYVNQVGGQDELVFDGASLVVSATGELLAAGVQFAEDLVVVDLDVPERPPPAGAVAEVVPATVVAGRTDVTAPTVARAPLPQPLDEVAEVYQALVVGTRDYLYKNGFDGAVIGLSGGIDSSLVATVAVDALGPEHVHALSMPSRYSSEGSRTDARLLADRLGIDLRTVPIDAAHSAVADLLAPALGHAPSGLTDENLQSRLRGLILMAVSNATGWIVLTTGNKSEIATGYSTLYGDSAGGFAVVKDVPKTLVYELCRYRNRRAAEEGWPEPVPRNVLDKPPSAELRPEQRDDQSLPPYERLDPILEAYVEWDRTAADLVADGFDEALVERVVGLVDAAEYKRRQMPPGVRITAKAFGKDRRMPITNHYRAAVGTLHPDLGRAPAGRQASAPAPGASLAKSRG